MPPSDRNRQLALLTAFHAGLFAHDFRGPRLLGIEAGDVMDRHFGIAVDVGTTTVAVLLVDLTTGRILETCSHYNAQIPCGVDVISRINYAAKAPRLEELRSRVLETVNRLLWEAAAEHGVNPGEIWHTVVSGNTVMTHLLLGLRRRSWPPPRSASTPPRTPRSSSRPASAATWGATSPPACCAPR